MQPREKTVFSVAEPEKPDELSSGATREREPVDFPLSTVVCKHDRLDPGEAAKTFRAMVAAVTAKAIAAKWSLGIGNDADYIVNRATSGGDQGCDTARARTIAGPHARAEGEQAVVRKRDGVCLSAEGRHTEHRPETILSENASVREDIRQKDRTVPDRSLVVRNMHPCTAGECVRYLGAQQAGFVAGNGAEVCIGFQSDTKRRYSLLEAKKKLLVDGHFDIDPLNTNTHPS
jgi:hypothetical protein